MSVFIEERDRAFFEAYKRAWEDGAETHGDALDMAIGSQTERLWVNEQYLLAVFDRMDRGSGCQPPSSRGGLYERAYAAYCSLRRSLGRRASKAYLVRHLVYRPWKGFPLSRRTATRILKRMRRGRQK